MGSVVERLFQAFARLDRLLPLRVLDRFRQTQDDSLVLGAQDGEGFVVFFFDRCQQVVAQ